MTTSTSGLSPAQEAGTTGSGCVFVVGMHRSGTSAATEVLASVGLNPPVPEDRFPTSQWNEHGNWESRGLTNFNDRLISQLGGTWSAPPVLGPGWERDTQLDEWRTRAKRLFARAYPRRPSLWKDPRLCLTLPFWRDVVEAPRAALLVYRDPLEVAGSLGARDGLTRLHSLALWERYTRAACTNLVGVPTFVSEHHRILEDPARWRRSVVDFLAGAGLAVEPPGPGEVPGSLDPRLRHHRSDGTVVESPGRSAQELFEQLRTFDGGHDAWQAPPLGEEPPWVGEVLDLHREVEQARRALASARSSRAYRVAGWLRGRGDAQ